MTFYISRIVPPELFVGRRRELDTAFAQIYNRGHIAIYGSPGMGKSSLLKYIQSPISWEQRNMDASQAFIVYLNCTEINPFTSSNFWRKILNLFKEQIDENEYEDIREHIDEILEEEEEEPIEIRAIRRLLKKIGNHQKFLLLLLDDYDHALRVHEPDYNESDMFTFLSEFRNLAVHSEESRHLATVVTTFRRLNELGPKIAPGGSPWYNHYLFKLLQPFSDNEVQEHFLTEGKPFYLNIPAQLNIEELLSLTGKYPILLQHLGFLLTHNNDSLRFQNLYREFEQNTRHIFDDIWKNSTEDEQGLLMLIALKNLQGQLQNNTYYIDDLENVFSQKQRELIDLRERGVISHIESNTYTFTTSLIESVIIDKIYETPELTRRGKWYTLLSRQQIKGVEDLISSVSKTQSINLIEKPIKKQIYALS